MTKIFYVGTQRSGTKSFGEFFKRNGLRVFSWEQCRETDLAGAVYRGRWLHVLKSGLFDDFDVYEDTPFWNPEFVAFIYHYIPESHFVYFHRPPRDWYRSMVTHSAGLTLGPIRRHCYYYDRLEELAFLQDELDGNLKRLPLIGMSRHYEEVYLRHRSRIEERFRQFDESRVFSASLYDKNKFKNMADHFGLKLKDKSEQHAHKSSESVASVMKRYPYLF